jgi:predicted CDP-diglyceride synthetase/phosphatidate cytidylyltransferase
MADPASVPDRPYWFPDVKGFLATAIILIIAALAFVMLARPVKIDQQMAGAFMTLLGVLTACLKDVYQYFFGSSSGSSKKDDAVLAAALPKPPAPPAAG